jgi:hypothetical protein
MEPKDYAITTPGKRTFLIPAIVVGACILVLVSVLAFTKAPADQWLHAWPAFACALVVPFVFLRAAHRSVRLDDQGLRIRTLPWPRTLALASIDLEQAQLVDLEARQELWPSIKIAGSRMPGYRAGRFRLRDGRTASVIVTDLNHVLFLPLRDGKVVLLSVERGQALLDAMRRRAADAQRGRG